MDNKHKSYSKTALLLLFLLSGSVMLATILYPLDKAMVIGLNRQRRPFFDDVFLYITHSAGLFSYGTVVVLLVASFWVEVKWPYYTVVLAGILSGLLVTAIKYGVQRIRPYHLYPAIHDLGPGGGWSYPSGHTADAFFLAAALALVYPRQRVLVGLCYLWAVLVGISRVYLGVHYLSDVLGAIAISSSCALAAFLVMQRTRPTRASASKFSQD